MAGGENRIPSGRKASRKRPNRAGEENPKTKKRVVLGEITNVCSRVSGEGKTRKPESGPVLEKPGNEISHEMAVSPGSDEPQKYGYAPSMLLYLRSLEVLCLSSSSSSWIMKRLFHCWDFLFVLFLDMIVFWFLAYENLKASFLNFFLVGFRQILELI